MARREVTQTITFSNKDSEALGPEPIEIGLKMQEEVRRRLGEPNLVFVSAKFGEASADVEMNDDYPWPLEIVGYVEEGEAVEPGTLPADASEPSVVEPVTAEPLTKLDRTVPEHLVAGQTLYTVEFGEDELPVVRCWVSEGPDPDASWSYPLRADFADKLGQVETRDVQENGHLYAYDAPGRHYWTTEEGAWQGALAQLNVVIADRIREARALKLEIEKLRDRRVCLERV